MGKITDAELASLTSNPKVRKIAIENIAMWLGSSDSMTEMMNLESDHASYQWNAPTWNAIMKMYNKVHYGKKIPIKRIKPSLAA